jgi:hypothetical protein
MPDCEIQGFLFKRENCCAKCCDNFKILRDKIQAEYYKDLTKKLEKFRRYNLRNNYKLFAKITSSYLNMIDPTKVNNLNRLIHTFTVPNKNLDYSIEKLSRLRQNGELYYESEDNLVEASLSLITRATLCNECYTKLFSAGGSKLCEKFAERYFRSLCVEKIINFVVEGKDMIPKMDTEAKKGKAKFSTVVKAKLFELKKEEGQILSETWRGSNYYYKQIFGIPIYLRDIVSREHYEKFHNGYISDVISGHPMASNGWMREAIDELEDRGVF